MLKFKEGKTYTAPDGSEWSCARGKTWDWRTGGTRHRLIFTRTDNGYQTICVAGCSQENVEIALLLTQRRDGMHMRADGKRFKGAA